MHLTLDYQKSQKHQQSINAKIGPWESNSDVFFPSRCALRILERYSVTLKWYYKINETDIERL
jgi:hypothetical protein